MKKKIWKWFDDEFKVHCDSYQDFEKMTKWTGCRDGGIYIYPDGHNEWDVIIPGKYLRRAIKLLRAKTKRRPQNGENAIIEPQQLTKAPK